MSFISDLEFGKANEEIVLERVRELFPLVEWEKSPNKKDVDIQSSIGHTIECKSDRLSLKTWNVFIEVECNNSPSWIYKYEKLDVLVYSHSAASYFVNVEKLKSFIEENASSLKKIRCGDGWRSVGYLIKLPIFEELASIIITND